MTEPIDFVICWVDGNDSEWQKQKQQHDPSDQTDSREIRYRDWDNLQYWFRGVEKFAPWVNKIHFVTWGHLPEWLNTEHPKLNIVRHEDYIPKKYLPTFSARPIEINLHRIEDLTEQFVFFNDDMFILKPVNKTDFFERGLPKDTAIMDIGIKLDSAHGSAVYNSIVVINKYFNKKKQVKDNFNKWYNLSYGFKMVKTLLLTPWNYFTGFYTPHLPNAFLKSTFEEVWNKERKHLELTSGNKFRSQLDLTQYIFKFWQLASGRFLPRKDIGRAYDIGTDMYEITEAISEQKHKLICINDNEEIKNFNSDKIKIINSFERILNKKSKFEL